MNTLNELITATLDGLDRLRQAGHETVSDETAEEMLRAVYTDRGGHLRQRSSLKKPTPAVSAFAAACRFHSGRNMGLFAPVMHSMTVGRALYDRLDTLALVARLVAGGRSVGSEAWARALGLQQA